jgi:hypothetical protein
MIRIKIKCREPSKVPKKRVMEMGDDIYLLKFKTEGVDQDTDSEDGGDGKGSKGDGEEHLEEDDLLDDDLGKADKDQFPQNDDTQKERMVIMEKQMFKTLGRIVKSL